MLVALHHVLLALQLYLIWALLTFKHCPDLVPLLKVRIPCVTTCRGRIDTASLLSCSNMCSCKALCMMHAQDLIANLVCTAPVVLDFT